MPTAYDPNDGTTAGASLIPTDLHPVNQTRSDARRAYYDPYATRSNLHIITGHQATRMLIDGYVGRSSVSSGNQRGEGSQTLTGGLFGDKPANSSLVRRNHHGLRVTGVEVSETTSCKHKLTRIVFRQCIGAPEHSRSCSRGYRYRRLDSFASATAAVRHRPAVAATETRHSGGPEPAWRGPESARSLARGNILSL